MLLPEMSEAFTHTVLNCLRKTILRNYEANQQDEKAGYIHQILIHTLKICRNKKRRIECSVDILFVIRQNNYSPQISSLPSSHFFTW